MTLLCIFSHSRVFASLNIQFGAFQVIENEHFVAYTLENFIAECGGLLGLFLGFSFTTVIDFIYRCMSACKAKKRSDFEKNHDECLR